MNIMNTADVSVTHLEREGSFLLLGKLKRRVQFLQGNNCTAAVAVDCLKHNARGTAAQLFQNFEPSHRRWGNYAVNCVNPVEKSTQSTAQELGGHFVDRIAERSPA